MSTPVTNNRIFRLGDLPRSVAGRVVKLPREMADSVGTRGREVWLAGLGALATVEEEGTQLFTSLVKQGEKLVERGEQVETKGRARIDEVRTDLTTRQKQVADQVTGRVQAVEGDVTGSVAAALRRIGVPTHGEVRELSDRVDALTRRVAALVDAMQKAQPEAPRPSFSVALREDGWAVSLGGEAEARGVYPTKEEALEAARSVAAAHAPSRLVVHRKDGTVQDTLSYEA